MMNNFKANMIKDKSRYKSNKSKKRNKPIFTLVRVVVMMTKKKEIKFKIKSKSLFSILT